MSFSWTVRQSSLYETFFHCNVLSKHHHHHQDDREILMKILPLRLSPIAPPYVSDVNGIIEGRTVEEKYNNKEESQVRLTDKMTSCSGAG
jgi:hypothetical protein